MNGLYEEMRHIRDVAERPAVYGHRDTNSTKENPQGLTTDLQRVLDGVADRWLTGDERLVKQPTSDGSPGFVIVLPEPQMWKASGFSVSAKENGDRVSLTVNDGLWEQVAGCLGSWADWTDAKVVYAGPVSEAKIAEQLEAPFLAWYANLNQVIH